MANSVDSTVSGIVCTSGIVTQHSISTGQEPNVIARQSYQQVVTCLITRMGTQIY